MKKYALLSALLAVMIFLSGCSLPSIFSSGEEETAENTIAVYRVAAKAGEMGDLLRQESITLAGGGDGEIESALAAFSGPSRQDSLSCALPEDVSIEDWALENGVLTLTLSDSYLSLSDMDRTVTAFCAVLTLCQLESVEAVNILSGGATVFAGLVPEDALLTDTDTDPYVRQLRLYFPDKEGRYLVSEYHSLTLEEETSPERYVVEELLRGPNNGELTSAIPSGTSLLSCSTTEGVCTVDLSSDFYDNRPQTALGERLTIYSLVNSLTALSAVDSVRFLVEGQPVGTYVYRSLSEPLARYDEAVGPASAPKGEFDTDLYLATPDLQGIAALSFRISESDYALRAEAVLAALMNTAEPGYPALFDRSGSVSEVTLTHTSCTVDLSEGFFVSLPENARNAAVQSIAATLCALPEISSVRFTIGGADAVFEGVDWSGPWRDFDEITVD